MENHVIEATELTPDIYFDPSKNLFVLSGNSSPEDALGFYASTMSWLEEYVKLPAKEIDVEFKFEYINSASSKIILHILFLLKKVDLQGSKLNIKWYFQDVDDEMKEAGETYAEIIEHSFEYIAY